MISLVKYKSDILNLFIIFNIFYLAFIYLIYLVNNLSITSILLGYCINKYEDTIVTLTRNNKYSNNILILIDKTRNRVYELFRFKRYIKVENIPDNNYVENIDDTEVIDSDTVIQDIVTNMDVGEDTGNNYSEAIIETQNHILGDIVEPKIDLNNVLVN